MESNPLVDFPVSKDVYATFLLGVGHLEVLGGVGEDWVFRGVWVKIIGKSVKSDLATNPLVISSIWRESLSIRRRGGGAGGVAPKTEMRRFQNFIELC